MISRTSNSERDHEDDDGNRLPIRTRLGLAGGAKGCIKGAIVGGVAGHMAGHGKLGAAAGCAIGHHEANKQNQNNSNAQAPSGQKERPGPRAAPRISDRIRSSFLV
ncbi:hypothetical protein BST65_16780 [Bradyrhizobium canariense]|nr:hypothetical protein BST65_16780 [Bradyrhizobium canariense]OSI34328.1 hypothetical protein BST66_11190 [Bradyrhizobium canariense]OSI45682.1 hypothetical protein BSZ20_11720 [Bradyrhizobium canariense]OSI48620.1 hypothetical protein BST67_18310 [Bradyrhizobium canariense]OSI53665.1 hypothetical protein BSZ15_25395 [Bradyrhizobium canariense]